MWRPTRQWITGIPICINPALKHNSCRSGFGGESFSKGGGVSVGQWRVGRLRVCMSEYGVHEGVYILHVVQHRAWHCVFFLSASFFIFVGHNHIWTAALGNKTFNGLLHKESGSLYPSALFQFIPKTLCKHCLYVFVAVNYHYSNYTEVQRTT